MSLEKLGFKLLQKTDKKYRVILHIAGTGKSGKSNFALTAPGPIAYFDLNRNVDWLIDKFTSSKKIYHKVYLDKTYKKADKSQAIKIMSTIYADLDKVLMDDSIRTIIIDTTSELWSLIRIATLGRLGLSKDIAYKYGEANEKYRTIFRAFRDYEKNVVCISEVKKHYVDNNWDGKTYIADEFSQMQHIVQAGLWLSHERKTNDFKAVLDYSVFDQSLCGAEFYNEEINFQTVMATLTNTEESKWM